MSSESPYREAGPEDEFSSTAMWALICSSKSWVVKVSDFPSVAQRIADSIVPHILADGTHWIELARHHVRWAVLAALSDSAGMIPQAMAAGFSALAQHMPRTGR